MKEEFPLRNFLYGGIAGSVAKTVVAPMDRVKIHFQVKTPHFSPFLGTAATTVPILILDRAIDGSVQSH